MRVGWTRCLAFSRRLEFVAALQNLRGLNSKIDYQFTSRMFKSFKSGFRSIISVLDLFIHRVPRIEAITALPTIAAKKITRASHV